MTRTFSALSALERIEALVDPRSLSIAPVPGADSSLALGSATISQQPVVLAFTDGHRRGGTFGVREAELVSALLDDTTRVVDRQLRPVVLLGFDTGGVRVEEGPRALAAMSGAGVLLAQLSLLGVRSLSLISGPRGCFGAPSVIAALPERVVMTEGSYWGLTGPKLIDSIRDLTEDSSLQAAAAANRLDNGDCDVIVGDDVDAVRGEITSFLQSPAPVVSSADTMIRASATISAALWRKMERSGKYSSPQPRPNRRRGLLEYSLRGEWRPSKPIQRAGMVQAGIGTLSGYPAIAFTVGPEAGSGDGLGIEESALICSTLARAAEQIGPRAIILNFLFCQGHAVDAAQEQFGVHRALSHVLRAMVAARHRGHPIVAVLGGGTYGAAYLALAAPSHRVLAMQGTSVAPMAPEVLRAFEELRGKHILNPAGAQLAERIPDVRIVPSVIRLPRILREELNALIAPAPAPATFPPPHRAG